MSSEYPLIYSNSNGPRYLRARDWLKAGNFRAAVLQLSQLVKDEPEETLYWTNYANALEGLAVSGDYARGIPMKDANGDPMSPEVLQEYALKARRKVVGKKSDNPMAWGQLATTLIRMDRPAEALEAIEEKLKLNPDSFIAYGMKAHALTKMERYDEALEAVGKARTLEPDNIRTEQMEKRIKDWKEAKEHPREFWERNGSSHQDELLDLYDEYGLDRQEHHGANSREINRR